MNFDFGQIEGQHLPEDVEARLLCPTNNNNHNNHNHNHNYNYNNNKKDKCWKLGVSCPSVHSYQGLRKRC